LLHPTNDGLQSQSKTWRLIVMYPSQFTISDIFPSKNSMVEPTAVILNKMEQQGRGLKYLRIDNAGENKALSQRH
jgi:hypothetical protein